jgi:hypothetical protein
MKKLFILTLVVIMLSLSVVPAFAAGGPPANRGTASGNGTQSGFGVSTLYALSGVIAAIDPDDLTVTVIVACGNHHGNSGQVITLQTTSNTRFLLRVEDGPAIPITFDDLSVGDNISSHGTLVDGIFTATRITSGALLICLSN